MNKFFLLSLILFALIFFTGSVFSENFIGSAQGQDTIKEVLKKSSQKRISSMKAKIELLQSNLEEVRKLASIDDFEKLLKPYTLPEKPKYPHVPEKKNSGAALKKDPGESDKSFNKRVEQANARDNKDFQFEEIAWRLQKQNIDDEYEENLKKSQKEYDEYVKKEKNKLLSSRNELGSLTEQTKKNVKFIYDCIDEENSLLQIFLNHKKESPLFTVCSCEQLQSIDKNKLRCPEINITCPEFTHKFGNEDYVFCAENVRLEIVFPTWEHARQFKMLAKSNKLFIGQTADINVIESLLNFKGTSRITFWNDGYRVRDCEILRFLWKKGLDNIAAPPVTVQSGQSSDEEANADNDESETFPALVPNAGISREPDLEVSEIMDTLPLLEKKNYPPVNKQAPVKYYLGTKETVLTDLEIFVKGDFVIKRVSKIVHQKNLPKTEIKSDGNILELGTKAGEQKVLILNGIEYVFRWCPPGKFRMGLNEFHDVTISRGFWMLETEVTQKMYKDLTRSNPSLYRGENLPVENVNWLDCLSFCDKLTGAAKIRGVEFKLPTEAQWEYACRAGSDTEYSFGFNSDLLYEYGNYCDMSNTNGWEWRDEAHNDRFDKTAPVKSFKPNPWGFYDMHGNVWEWCGSRFGTYTKIPETDPIGPNKGTFRIFRGGSWSIGMKDCQSGTRFAFVPDFHRDDIGFRICLTPETSVETGYIE